MTRLLPEEIALIERRRLNPPRGAFWVFGYGSLMWRPDFPFVEARAALLRGYHRAFCIISTRYRGTADHPGRVLGLAPGGACKGRAFRIAPKDRQRVATYLHERELITGCYEPRFLPVRLEDGRKVTAVAYVADRSHWQYAGHESPAKQSSIIRAAVGVAGPNIDYLRNTVAHLDELGIVDCALHKLLDRIDRKRG